jgi:hypothetical protein
MTGRPSSGPPVISVTMVDLIQRVDGHGRRLPPAGAEVECLHGVREVPTTGACMVGMTVL